MSPFHRNSLIALLAAVLAIGAAGFPDGGGAPKAQAQDQSARASGGATWTPPQRRRIILMRHGDVSYFDAQGNPVADPDKVILSDKGKAQADASGTYLKSIGITKFDRIVTSDLPRTIETATRVLSAFGGGGTPMEMGALREMRNGPTKDIATADLPRELLMLAQPKVPGDARFLRRESVAELQARIEQGLKPLIEDRSWDTALLVLHALVNNAILSTALAGDAAYFGRFDHGAGCLAIIDVGADLKDAVIKAVNVCPDPGPYASRLKTLESLLAQALKGRQQ